jgi:hypothetical protein
VRLQRASIIATVAALGLLIRTASGAPAQQPGDCGYYVNSAGQTVPRPCGNVRTERPPRGATAICRDGDYSFSRHHRGTCSGHGGVRAWLR